MPFDYGLLIALDSWWLEAINKLGEFSFVALPAKTLGFAGSAWIWLAIALFFLVVEGRAWFKWCALLVVALLLTGYLTDILKVVVARPRPYLILTDIVRFAGAEPSFAFPSGHASRAFAAAAILAASAKRWRWLWFTLAGIVAISRVILGLHYPSDVIGGAIIGYGIGWGFVGLLRFWETGGISRIAFKRKLEKDETL